MPGPVLLALCLIAGTAPPVRVPADHFTLSWTHSIEKVEWREEYQVTPAGLVIEKALVKGSGVGMEPGPDARLVDGWWVSRPTLAPIPELTLAASHYTADHVICTADHCAGLHEWLGSDTDAPVRMVACPARD